MQQENKNAIRRFGNRAFRILICLLMVFQTLWFPNHALAASAFSFRGFGSENVSGNTFAYATSGATVSGTTVTASADSTKGMAVGLINLDEDGNDISKSVDLGGLEIDFSTLATVTQEGTEGAENDVPTVDIDFCSSNDIGSSISSVHLTKPDNAVSGGVTLSSGAHIPSGTRSIFITLTGTNTTGSNTVVFSDTSLVIRDAGAPSCSVDYNKNWTNQDVTVTITASDADAGLEGIYRDGSLVSTTSPYAFVVSSNNTSFSVYAKDLAGKQSDPISETIDKIDKTVPSAPTSVPLSNNDWSNTDVAVNMPALGTSSGAPERYVYQTGTSGWADLTAGYAISTNGYTTIRVAVEDAAGNRSSYLEATAKIDKLAPTIGTPTMTVGSGSTRVDITATEQGLSGLKRFAYAAGTQTADYFAANGTDIVDNTFTITAGGNYTVFASDNAGNTALQPLSLTTAPTLAAISDVSIDEDQTKNVPLTVSDAESKLSELSVKVTTTNDALLSTVTVNKADTGISLDITPASNQSGGPVTVTVEVMDPGGLKVTRSFNVTVNAVNDPPLAQKDSGIVLDEDTTATIDVLANDSDLADGDTLSIASVGNPAHGTALIVLGKVRYTPDADYAGTDTFDYTVSDGKDGTAIATVSVTVTNVNDAPVAKPDTATVREDIPAKINVLSNDFDVDTAADTEEHISLFSCTNGSHGTAVVTDDGMVEYTPAANYNGTDTFTYTIQDRLGLASEATVTVVVSPDSDEPIFTSLLDEYTIDEDAKNAEIAFEISDVETPLNSVMLQAASLNTEILEQSGITITDLGDNLAAVKLLLSPVADMYGDVQILLTLGDGFNTVERTITVHVKNVNDAPRAGADTVNYTEGAAYVDISIADLLSNDSDIEHNTITFDGLVLPTTVGTIEKLDSTTLRYTPVPHYDGTDSFTYYISDGTAKTLATCTLQAVSVNDAPTIKVVEASYRTNEDTKVVIPFEISDQESDAASLSVVAATSDDSIVTTDGIVIVNKEDGTGEVQITPVADANGTLTITLTVSDGEAQSSCSFSLVIDPVQDAPLAVNDKVYVLYSGSRVFSVLENDHDVDGEPLTVDQYAAKDLRGTLKFDEATQLFTYYPAIGENGVSTFTYTVTDGSDTATATATGTVTLNVSTVTHAPVITSIDSKYVSEDNTLSGIAFSVSDEDFGDTASITVTPANTTLLPNDGSHIQVTNLGEGNYLLSLIPGADQFGSTSVKVTVTDSTLLTDSTTFNLVVLGQNDAPLAVNDEFTINEDGSLPLTLLSNDSDPDGDTIWLASISLASHGYIEGNGRVYTYYPYDNWHGTDTITYRVSDGRITSQASATITVNPVNDSPVARDDWRALPNNVANESAEINVLGNDYDVDTGDVIHTYQIMTPPHHGTAVINANGTITYTRSEASPEANGADWFVYRIIDREAATGEYCFADATVHIGIEFRSSLYTYGESVTCREDDDPFNFDLSITNPNGVDYTLTVNTPTTLGTFTVLDNNTVQFAPARNQYGSADITYTVEQTGGGEKHTGTIWLRVYPVNDPPVIDSVPASVTMNEDTPGGSTFDVTFRDPDCANDDLYFYVYTQNGATTGPIPFQTNYTVSRDGGTATVTVTTATNSNGTGKIVVGVSDGISYDEEVIDLTVTPVDDAPVVNSVERTIYEDSRVTFASPGSDSEADGDKTKESILPADAPKHGTATINSNQTILYVPDANFYGTDTFYVSITDQTTTALSNRAMVTIHVTPVNDQPEIFDLDYYQSTPEDTAKDVTLTVIDVDNDLTGAGSYTITSGDQKLVKDENISIVNVSGNQMKIHLIPEANANGKLVVSIVASDGSLTAEGAFELKIVPVNDVPVAKNDTGNMDEAVSTGAETTPPKTTTTLNLLTNDSDIEDGKPRIVSITNVVNGTVTNLGNGTVSVSADGDSTADVTFTYTVMDRAGAKASATVKVTINAKNDPPIAKDDYLTINEDAQSSINVLTNDSDPEGDTLSISTVPIPKHGTASINGTSVDYVPTKDYYGSDYFTYTVSDGNEGAATATVRITIKPVNDAPSIAQIASGDKGWTMEEDAAASFDFTVADAETAVSGLIIKITSLDPTIIRTEQIALSTNETGNKTITVTPETDAHGEARIKFWVSDGLLSTEKIYIITVTSVNDAPIVTAEKQKIKEDKVLTASASATDADGDSVTFAKSTDPAHGTVVVSANGTFVYTPAKDFNGEDSFVVLADDGNEDNHVGFATVYITVTPDGDPPIAGDDSITIDEDTPSVITVLKNDSDPDEGYGDKISIYHISTPAHGTAEIDDNGILYTPTADYNGTDSFTYTITDLDGKMDTASVSITIDPVNDTPRDGNDIATVLEDHSITIDAAANDDVDETTNPTLEDVTITQVDVPAHGTAFINTATGSKTITYTPKANWFSLTNEPEVFYYTATDSSGKTARFSITVTVTSVNDLPEITPDKLADVETFEDTETSAITFTVSDIETAAGSLSVSVTHNNSTLLPTVTVTPDASGACSFTVMPKADKVGNATFTVTVTDADGGKDSSTFTLKVKAVNDLPKAKDDAFTVAENSSRIYNVLENDDVDTQPDNGGDTLKLLRFTNPQFGTVTIENNEIKYVPKSDRSDTANYTDEFTYTMMDSSNTESTAKVTVTVTPVNDPPKMTAIADVTGIQEDASNGTGEISFSVTDEEDDDDTLKISIESGNPTLFPVGNITIVNPTDDATGSLRTVKVVPATDQFGTGSITLKVTDSLGLFYKRTFSVTVESVDDIPTNGNKTFEVTEDIEMQLDVLTGIDVDYATKPSDITVKSIATPPTNGTAYVAADGRSIYYKTAKDSNLPDSFEYTIHDAFSNADYTFTASITVIPVNDAPVIKYTGPSSYETYQGTPKNDIPFTVEDVDNVTDASGTKPVEVRLSAKSSNTLLLRNGINIDTLDGNNRNIDLQPYLKWNGTTTVTITAKDPGGLTATASFQLTVNNVNDSPVAVNDTGIVQEDKTTAVYVLVNDLDDDLLTNPDTEFIKIKSVIDNDPNATIEPASDGLSVLVTPNTNYNGPVTFTYTIEDALHAESNSATVSLTVAQVNDAPVAGNDAEPTTEDTPVKIFVLVNDSDIDKDESLNAHWEAESIGVVITGDALAKPAHGKITTDGTTITYTPNKDYNGRDTFEYYCSDGEELAKASVTVTITQVNDAPVANPDVDRIDEDSETLFIDVMANDTDVDTGETLNQNDQYLISKFSVTAASLTDTNIGTVDLTGNKIKFTPKADWFGTATINYTLDDGYFATCNSTLTVTVDPVNDLPVFSTKPENLTISEDGADGTTDIVVGDVETKANLLAVTVLESSNPSLIATTDVTVSAGTNGNRTITVNPKDNQNGTATITLQVDDLTLGKTTIKFVVTVDAVNDDPVADAKTLDIAEDASFQTITKASVAHDVDIKTNDDALTLSITGAASHGTAEINADGNITYIPLANFNGTDTFEYTVTDKLGAANKATITVNVSASNDAPVAGNDAEPTTEDTPVKIFVLVNDSDIDKDESLNAHWEAESIGVVITGDALAKPAHGTITTDGTTITYTPNKDYNGSDTFEYYCSDGEELAKASVTVTITQVNDNPIAVSDSGSTDEDVPVSVNVLGNDTDVDAISSLNENELHKLTDLSIVSCSIFGTAHGTVTKNGASIDYDPEPDFYGTQTIHYVLSDGHEGTSIGTLIIEVGSENDAPVAVDDEMSADEDHTASVNVLENDTDVDIGDTKTFVGFTEPTSGLPGMFTTNAKGDITFTPDDNYNGSFSISYQMKDTNGLTSTAKITVTINPVNDTPTAIDTNVTTDEDHAKDTDVSSLIGDADILLNEDELTVTVALAGSPQHGTASVSGTTITYTPDANYNGSDEIVYTVTDKAGAHASAKLNITVNPVNDAPVAQNDTKPATEDTAVTIAVRSNDSDIDTDALLNKTPAAAPFIESVTNGLHGKATTDGDTITYTPDKDYNGTDEISYVLSDGSSTDEAKVSITITQVNDQIQAADDTAQTNDEDLVTIDVLKNDTDVDTDTALNKDVLHLVSDFVLTAVGTPEHGTAKIVSGKIDYKPEDRFAGSDHFTYTVSDGHGSSQTAWINVTVLSVNDPPVIIVVSKPQTGDRAGTGSKVTVEWKGFDIDGDTLTYKLDYFDGTSWHPVADNLAGTTYVFSIPASLASTDGLKFRVNVRDSEFTSDYGYSGIMSVDRDAPTGSVVTMHTADGRTYTAGTWTNQTVTVVAASAVDASKVTYYYAMDDGTSAAATSMDVVSGVHTVNVLATDEFDNTANLGGYLARVDKQQPAEPDVGEIISGGAVVLSFTFHADPGGSGNNKITLPDGTVVSAADQPTFTVTKNGTYNFSLTDIAGNRKTFSYTVSKVDTSNPVIALNSGAYSVGSKTQDAISATLTFTDAQSEITARGYQISTSSTASGTYRAYSSALTLSNPGTYYIHAMAKNAFGLTTYQTFGPFIIEAAPAAAAETPALPPALQTPVPEKGDVVVTKEDVEGIPGDAVSIRLPGGEWSDSLTLEDVEPGTYLVEVKDKDGNIRTVEVRVTKRDIVAHSVRSEKDNITPAAIATIIGGTGILLLLLLAIGHNVTVTVTGMMGGAEKDLRTLRRIKGRKKELVLKLDDKHIKGGQYVVIKLAKRYTKNMRGNTVVLTIRGVEVFRETIPEDNKEAFIRTILIDQ